MPTYLFTNSCEWTSLQESLFWIVRIKDPKHRTAEQTVSEKLNNLKQSVLFFSLFLWKKICMYSVILHWWKHSTVLCFRSRIMKKFSLPNVISLLQCRTVECENLNFPWGNELFQNTIQSHLQCFARVI